VSMIFPTVEKVHTMERMAARQNKTKLFPSVPCLSAFAQLAGKTGPGDFFCVLMEVGIAGKDFRYGR
jgi:hypothetical protein